MSDQYPTRCPCCGRYLEDVENRRLNTAYESEESNWILSCRECYDEAVAYYAEMWDEYYSGRL